MQHYRRSDDAIFADVGRDVVALHVQRGHCYGMEAVTADVWHLLTQPIGLDELCDRLTERYEVDRDRCRSDVATLLDQMVSEGLVEAV